jgi:chromosome segregation ATPase
MLNAVAAHAEGAATAATELTVARASAAEAHEVAEQLAHSLRSQLVAADGRIGELSTQLQDADGRVIQATDRAEVLEAAASELRARLAAAAEHERSALAAAAASRREAVAAVRDWCTMPACISPSHLVRSLERSECSHRVWFDRSDTICC